MSDIIDAPLVQTFLNDDDFHPVTCVKCGHVGGLKVSLSELLLEMMQREERSGFDRGWGAAVTFFVEESFSPTTDPVELRRRAVGMRETVDAEARKLEQAAWNEEVRLDREKKAAALSPPPSLPGQPGRPESALTEGTGKPSPSPPGADEGPPCVSYGKRSRITTAGCDHCDYEDK